MTSDPLQLLTIIAVAILGLSLGAAVRLILRVGMSARSTLIEATAGIVVGAAAVVAQNRVSPLVVAVCVGLAVVILLLQIDMRDHFLDLPDALVSAHIAAMAMSLPISISSPDRHAPALIQGVAAFGTGAFAVMTIRRGRSRTLVAAVSALAIAALWLLRDRIEPLQGLTLTIAVAVLLPTVALVSTLLAKTARVAEIEPELGRTLLTLADARQATALSGRFRNPNWISRDAWKRASGMLNILAVRKQQQRRMPAAIARLYELELMKLRMELVEVVKIEMMLRAESGSVVELQHGATSARADSY